MQYAFQFCKLQQQKQALRRDILLHHLGNCDARDLLLESKRLSALTESFSPADLGQVARKIRWEAEKGECVRGERDVFFRPMPYTWECECLT